MDLRPHIEKFARRLAEVEAALSAPDAFAHAQRAQELAREHARLKELVTTGAAYQKVLADLADNSDLLKTEAVESELAVMAREEIARLEAAEKKLAQQVQFGLVPPNPTDSRNTIDALVLSPIRTRREITLEAWIPNCAAPGQKSSQQRITRNIWHPSARHKPPRLLCESA